MGHLSAQLQHKHLPGLQAHSPKRLLAFSKRSASFIFYAGFVCVAKHTKYCTHVVVALGLLKITLQCKPFLAVTYTGYTRNT